MFWRCDREGVQVLGSTQAELLFQLCLHLFPPPSASAQRRSPLRPFTLNSIPGSEETTDTASSAGRRVRHARCPVGGLGLSREPHVPCDMVLNLLIRGLPVYLAKAITPATQPKPVVTWVPACCGSFGRSADLSIRDDAATKRALVLLGSAEDNSLRLRQMCERWRWRRSGCQGNAWEQRCFTKLHYFFGQCHPQIERVTNGVRIRPQTPLDTTCLYTLQPASSWVASSIHS